MHDQLLPARQLFLPSTGRRNTLHPDPPQHGTQSERGFARETCARIPQGTATPSSRSKPCPFFKKDRIARSRSRSFCATSTSRRCCRISAVVCPHAIPPRLIPPPLPAVHLRLRGAAVLQVQLPPILSSYAVGYHNLRSVCQEAMDECGASEAKTSYRCNLLRETGERDASCRPQRQPHTKPRPTGQLSSPSSNRCASTPPPHLVVSNLNCSPLPLFSKKVLAGMARVQNAEDLTMPSWPVKIALLRRQRCRRRAFVCVALRVQKSPCLAPFSTRRAPHVPRVA